MKLGFVSDSPGAMPLGQMLDNAARMGVSGVEVNTCGWSTAPHFDLPGMLSDAAALGDAICHVHAKDTPLNALGGLKKSVALLRGVMPCGNLDYAPQEV